MNSQANYEAAAAIIIYRLAIYTLAIADWINSLSHNTNFFVKFSNSYASLHGHMQYTSNQQARMQAISKMPKAIIV